MTHPPVILHIVDDTTPGGVMRVLDHLASCPLIGQTARHICQSVPRGRALPGVQADIIVSHLSVSWRSLPGLISFRARHAGTPLIHVEHSYTEAFTALNVPSRARFYTLLRTAYALFDRVVAVSGAQADWLLARALVRKASLRTIRSCVNLDTFRALPRQTGHPNRFGAIGRLDHQKGFDLLVAAFKAVPDVSLRLDIFGDGPDLSSLQTQAAGDARIRFRGHTTSPEAAIGSVDAILMPSRWEAFGLVALEARAAGIPQALAKVDGLQEQIHDGTLAVSGHTIAEWSDAIQHLAKTPPHPDIANSCATAEQVFANAWASLIEELRPQKVMQVA
ncbi:glycosyltransferase [Actibacterium atlanticum]|uniref:Glycosyltransferase n=1 Tax=Actibacterium atlanticum TaxID=1461693 RepID=A0A058ZP30_9RHOB|nr:glycosyltransferase family 4 protein [Actibacterium atlanticum]KCV83303.1 glycosyltransferase [Actibacterium atlanticum]